MYLPVLLRSDDRSLIEGRIAYNRMMADPSKVVAQKDNLIDVHSVDWAKTLLGYWITLRNDTQ